MNTPTLPIPQQRRLRAHFGFSGVPFRKNVSAARMFDSTSQRDLRHGLQLWLELTGLGLVTGPSGVGKSISLRRFVSDLPSNRYTVYHYGQIRTTPTGFMRSLSRRLNLRTRLHLSDMFDEVTRALATHQEDHNTHPVLILDDAEGMRSATLDLVRRLTSDELDTHQHVSILLSGTEEFMRVLQDPTLTPLRSRVAYAHSLRGFRLEDVRNYIRFHLDSSGVQDLFGDGAVREIFRVSQGVPRQINQLALQALVEAVVRGVDHVDQGLMERVIRSHPLYAR